MLYGAEASNDNLIVSYSCTRGFNPPSHQENPGIRKFHLKIKLISFISSFYSINFK